MALPAKVVLLSPYLLVLLKTFLFVPEMCFQASENVWGINKRCEKNNLETTFKIQGQNNAFQVKVDCEGNSMALVPCGSQFMQ